MEQNVLRSNWPISDQEYPVGIHSSMEQQHFPTLMPFSSYSAFPPPPTRFKEASPRTFGSLYPPSSTQSSHLSLHSLPLSLSIPRPSGSRKASEEERKAKHREAQRRFVKRKKVRHAHIHRSQNVVVSNSSRLPHFFPNDTGRNGAAEAACGGIRVAIPITGNHERANGAREGKPSTRE